MNKVSIRFAILLLTVLIISGISHHVYADTLRFSNVSSELRCEDIELESYEAVPMTNILITGIPENYEGLIGAEILNNDEVIGVVMADRYRDGSWYLISPVNPEFSNKGTTITLRMVDENITCDPFEFEILEMPLDPLDLDAYMNSFEEVIGLIANHQGYTIDELVEMDEQTAEARLQPAIFISKMVRGADGYTDLRAMMSRENLGMDLDDDEWDLLMTLYGRAFSQADTTSGIQLSPTEENDAIRGQSGFNLDSQPDYREWASSETLGTPKPWEYGNETSFQLDYCSVMYPNMTAEVLEIYLKNYYMFDREIRSLQLTENERRAIMVSLTIVGAIATGGSSAAIGVATAGAGATFSITGFLLEFLRALYPNEVFDFYVENYGPDRFLEDDIDLTGSWEKAFISASSDSFDFGSEGMRAIWGAVSGFIMYKIPGGADAPTRLASEAGKAMTSDTINHMLGKMPGTRQIPACEIGPVDISDEKYTRFYALENDDVVEFQGHHEFKVIGTGQAELVVCALETLMRDASGTPLCIDSHNFLVTVPRIDVHIVKSDRPNTRGRIRVTPGEILELEALVQNANDETVSWSVDPPGRHSLTVYGYGKEATLVISDDDDHFPFMLTVESMSNSGLRADPNAPAREQTRIVDLIEIEEYNTNFSLGRLDFYSEKSIILRCSPISADFTPL